ncbi:arginase family protein [Lysinibacter sp. HNR]|uniref:arginase family protein n=1 Tax=Lysinibacter sp. HNR TaxID=3031408 RepID=UPI002434AB59|nr:arginase family protein [Lysinibacter sp. HNR]WGD36890.1 arginase family protein [Lysinibacter sp. HNR]
MTVEFLVFPQWQGSSASRAMLLSEGAHRIAEELPPLQSRFVDVLPEAGDSIGTPVKRVSSLQYARTSAQNILSKITSTVITVGGDLASDLAGAEYALSKHGAENVAVIWFSARGNFDTPETAPSGAFSEMALRALLGEGLEQLLPRVPAVSRNVIIAGVRDCSDSELANLTRAGVQILSPVDLEDPETLAQAVAETGASHAYVHIDLAVLDPSEYVSVHSPVPFGLSVSQLSGAVRSIWSVAELAGGGIYEYAPAGSENSEDDLTTVLRLIAALTA